MVLIGRLILTALLLWSIYTETGPFTTFAFFVTAAAVELFCWQIRRRAHNQEKLYAKDYDQQGGSR